MHGIFRKKACIAVPVCDITEKPAFYYRQTFYRDTFRPGFSLPNRLNSAHCHEGIGEVINYGIGFVHTFDKLIPDVLFEEHPEYFPMIDGVRQKGAVPSTLFVKSRCIGDHRREGAGSFSQR